MMGIKLLEVVTPPYIYHGCFTWKKFWEEIFTGEEKFTLGVFTAVNMKNCGCRSVRKHIEIKYGDNYITLDILLKFGSLDNMRVTSSDPKDDLVSSGKGLITSLVIKSKAIPNE